MVFSQVTEVEQKFSLIVVLAVAENVSVAARLLGVTEPPRLIFGVGGIKQVAYLLGVLQIIGLNWNNAAVSQSSPALALHSGKAKDITLHKRFNDILGRTVRNALRYLRKAVKGFGKAADRNGLAGGMGQRFFFRKREVRFGLSYMYGFGNRFGDIRSFPAQNVFRAFDVLLA